MVIRKATEADVAHIFQNITSAIHQLQSNGIDAWAPGDPSLEDTIKNLPNTYVGEEKNSIIASIVIDERQPHEYAKSSWRLNDPHPLVMHRFFVAPAYQRKGIGHAILQFVETFAKEQGYRSIRLGTFSKNPRSISFYQKEGYAHVGQFIAAGYKPDPFITFEKIL